MSKSGLNSARPQWADALKKEKDEMAKKPTPIDPALLWFAMQSGLAFETVTRLHTSKKLANALLENGMSYEQVLFRISRSVFADKLFGYLVLQTFGTAAWDELLEAICKLPSRCWSRHGGGFTEAYAMEILLSRFRIQDHSLTYLQVRKDYDHPLFSHYFANPYWMTMVTNLITVSEYRLAWYNILQADIGIEVNVVVLKSNLPNLEFVRVLPPDSVLRATRKCIEQMINLLFNAMVIGRIIEAISPLREVSRARLKARSLPVIPGKFQTPQNTNDRKNSSIEAKLIRLATFFYYLPANRNARAQNQPRLP